MARLGVLSERYSIILLACLIKAMFVNSIPKTIFRVSCYIRIQTIYLKENEEKKDKLCDIGSYLPLKILTVILFTHLPFSSDVHLFVCMSLFLPGFLAKRRRKNLKFYIWHTSVCWGHQIDSLLLKTPHHHEISPMFLKCSNVQGLKLWS